MVMGMGKQVFWKSDWFFGLAISLLVLVLGNGDLLQSLERKAYDVGVSLSSQKPNDRIAVIAIDKQSIDNIGRWPWSREIQAEMVDKLAAARARVIATTVFYSEPQLDPGLAYINRLLEIYGKAEGERVPPVAPVVAPPVAPADSAAAAAVSPMQQMGAVLAEAENRLNTDRRLAESLARAGNVVLPVLFRLGEPMGRPDHALPDYLGNFAIQAESGKALPIPAADTDALVIEPLGKVAGAIGQLNSTPDVDGAIRSEPLVVRYFDQLFPSLSLMIAARSLNLGVDDIHVVLGRQVSLGKLKIGTDEYTRMNPFFYRDGANGPAFQVDSFFDVRSGKIPPEKYRDKIVLIGPTAAGVGSVHPTPVSPAMPDVLVLAHDVSSLLSEHFFVVPDWAFWAEKAAWLVVALYLIAVLPRLKAGMGASITAALLLLLLGGHFFLMTTQLLWLHLMIPATLLLLGHLLLTTKRFLMTERGKEKSDLESSESNRMLGLAFQGQGQLDMAFDKFRKCAMDEGLMENLYNLALDFERKRQFNKAEAVFRHMSGFNPKFRDLEQRLTRAKQMSETVILGGAGQSAGSLLSATGEVEKPMLGRYQIEKELGKGAMGVVYLGRDPKINRVVAIKTMALAQEFEGDELVEIKARFFREAETAGRLNHQNIVTVYDAGEEHDLAYIAMEFLKGKDLVAYTKPGNLLPVKTVVSVIARVADALSYAHEQHIVHRDIKPANIMYEPEGDTVKVADFGIARITDSSKTKTGMVLGTPSFMSPEQLSGKKVDGRSDLFSLGVALYQLLSGRLPFEGDSMAQLMYKIANDKQEDLRKLNPAIPARLSLIVDKAMIKDPEKRYQTGAQFAQDLRQCLGSSSAKPQ